MINIQILDFNFCGHFAATVWLPSGRMVEITRELVEVIEALEAKKCGEFGRRFYDRDDNMFVEVIGYRKNWDGSEDEFAVPQLVEDVAAEYGPDHILEICSYMLEQERFTEI